MSTAEEIQLDEWGEPIEVPPPPDPHIVQARAELLETIASMTPPPCKGCRLFNLCRDYEEACLDFALYVDPGFATASDEHAVMVATLDGPREPEKWVYEFIYTQDEDTCSTP